MIKNVPKHIAVIMDGNGRWAKTNNKTRLEGHKRGVAAVREIIKQSLDIGLDTLTLYTFSKDNWKRPKKEINGLIKLFSITIKNELLNFHKNNIKVSFMGDINSFPENIIKLVQETGESTLKNTSLNLNIALGYSSREEILHATKSIITKVQKNHLDIDDLTEDVFSDNLYNSYLDNPDLLIRTGGEYRISDFMLWQIAYSEIYFTKKYWPDFDKQDFLDALYDYDKRERRFGKISEQVQ